MNKGYAFGFLIVILVLVLGMYVAYTGFESSREAIRAQPTSPPSTEEGQAAPPTLLPPQRTVTPTVGAILTSTVQIAITAAIEGPAPTNTSPAPTNASAPTKAPAATEPPPPPTATPASQIQPPTPVPAPAYQFRLAGPPAGDASFGCCYLFGTVRDANGNGLEGILVQARNEWNTLPPAATKGGAEIGQYNIPIGRDVVTWDIVVQDPAGNQISTKVQVQFNPDEAQGHRIDWQRTY